MGLNTLQWIKVKASPHNPQLLTGGTQDNGTWETPGNPTKWENTMIGDGGWPGFDIENPDFRFHNFFDATPEVNFEGGNIAHVDLDRRTRSSATPARSSTRR